jgi:acyl transferase domain-containing protein/thioesterase domain-containing protein/SAM-dependent methyltransferase/aryl carrier-like protein
LPRPLAELSREGTARSAVEATAVQFALEYALAALWRAWGIRPQSVVGRGAGECVAACIAGVFSLADAARLTLAMAVSDAARREVARSIVYARPTLAFHGGARRRLTPLDVADSAFWLAEREDDASGASAVADVDVDIFLDIGGRSALATLAPSRSAWLHSVEPGPRARESLLSCLGALFIRGARVDWQAVEAAAPGRTVSLPTYPFERQPFWIAPLEARASAPESRGPPNLLGERLPGPPSVVQYESRLGGAGLRSQWLADHRIHGRVVFPAAAYLELVWRAGTDAFAADACMLEGVTIERPLILTEEAAQRLQLVISVDPGGEATVELHSRLDEHPTVSAWTRHVRMRARYGGREPAGAAAASLAVLRAALTEAIDSGEHYQRLRERGLEYGPAFRGVAELYRSPQHPGASLARVVLPDTIDTQGYVLHPALLDACLHAGAEPGTVERSYVPVAIERAWLRAAPGREVWSHVRPSANRSGSGDALFKDVTLYTPDGEVVLELVGLRTQAVEWSAGADGVGRWLWETRWEKRLPSVGSLTPGRWLVVGDGGPLTRQLVRELDEDGHRCTVVDSTAADAASASGLAALAQGLASSHEVLPWSGVIYLRGARPQGPSGETLLAEQRGICGGLLHLAQALLRVAHQATPRLWVITQDAQASSQQPLNLAATTLLGLGRAIAEELPAVRCTRIDVGQSTEIDRLAKDVVAELAATDDEDEVALRPDGRFVSRIVRHAGTLTSSAPVRADASYLITGGLGALGLEVAKWLTACGARHLVLMGRHGASLAVQDVIRALEQQGATVRIVEGDVAHREQVAAVLRTIAAEGPALRGIIHAAGVLADAALLEQTVDGFDRVLAPKALGAWWLHDLTQAMDLDFFVLFSSTAATYGGAGQANYAAANAWLDALVLHRQALGLVAQGLSWTAWADIGMAARTLSAEELRKRGIEAISRDTGLDVLAHALSRRAVQWIVQRDERKRRKQRVEPDAAPSAKRSGDGALLAELAGLDDAGRRARLGQRIRQRLAETLGVAAEQPDENQSLREFGVDSLTAVELQELLSKDLGQRLPATLFFDRPSIRAVTDYLLETVLAVEHGPEPAVAAAAARDEALGTAEPIAIIGMACRFPAAEDLDAYWSLLEHAVDPTREVPHERWNPADHFDPDRGHPGRSYSRWGAFVERIAEFDAKHFGVRPVEASRMDPQQRLMLETTWEAFEHAGIDPTTLAGSATGVFVGVMGNDYDHLRHVSYLLAAHISSRVSYCFDLHGPSESIDTMCSSSLVALHHACRSLRLAETSLAVVGGVNALLAPQGYITICGLSALSATPGPCKTFDARGDGYVRGEGCGVVVLKRLYDARRDGDRILAVVHSSVVSHGGHAQGYTVPNGREQHAMIGRAWSASGLAATDIGYLEAHGTGTELGDPQELEAIAGVLHGVRDRAWGRVPVASVKSNFGHLEGAAGIAGVIKAVLCLEAEQIAPHRELREVNKHLPLEDMPLQIPTERQPWRGSRMAGVSSFGMSGTIAHVVLERASAPAAPPELGPQWELLALSARSATALRQLAARYLKHLAEHPEQRLADVCFTANSGRAALGARLTVRGRTATEIQAGLKCFLTGGASDLVVVGQTEPGSAAEEGEDAALTDDAWEQRIAACARRFAKGAKVDWNALYRGQVRVRVDVPTYAFERQRYWLETRDVDTPPRATTHPLLGERLPSPLQTVQFEALYGAARPGSTWLFDHRVRGQAVFAATAYLERVQLGMGDAFGAGPWMIEEVVFERPFLLSDHDEQRLELVLSGAGSDGVTFEQQSRRPGAEGQAWTLHARGTVRRRTETAPLGSANILAQLQGALTRRVDANTHYQSLGEHGLDYGPAFRCLTELFRSDALPGQSLAHLSLPAALDIDGYVGHPSLLDACLHSGAFPNDERSPGVPVSIERFCLTAPLPREVWCHTRLHSGDQRHSDGESRDVTIYAPSGEVIGEITGLRVRHVQWGQRDDAPERWLYDLTWELKSSLEPTGPRRSDFLKPPSWINAKMAEQPLQSNEADEAWLAIARSELSLLASAYLLRAFDELGFDRRRGREFSLGELAAEARIVERHERLLPRLLAALEEVGVLQRHGAGWQVARDDFAVESAIAHAVALRERHPSARPELALLARCGERFAAVLRGEQDPLDLLFGGGSETSDLYRESVTNRSSNLRVQRAVACALAGMGADRTLRILEVGAGTGGTTGYLLPELPSERCEYLFSDRSSAFFAKASARFRDYPFVRYRALDIELEPEAQGFASESVDVVVATNVLHATRDLRQTLANIRRLLAPAGLLILVEATSPSPFLDMTFGLTDGWWRFADRELRPDYPLLPYPRWHDLLRGAGFADAVDVGFGRQAVIVASRDGADVADQRRASPQTRGRWLIVGEDDALAQALEAQLTEGGGSTTRFCGPGDQLTRAIRDYAATVPNGEGCGVIYLGARASVTADPTGASEILAGQEVLCGNLLHLVQELLAVSHRVPARIWLVTRGAQAPLAEHPDVFQASLWGFGRVLANEYPEFQCRLVDLDARADVDGSQLAAAVVSELSSTDGEDEVALRAEGRFVTRVARHRPPASAALQLREDATYLVVGGLGGLGLEVIGWMAERGARHIVTMNRAAPSPQAEARLRALEQGGLAIVAVPGDVTVAADLDRVLATIDSTMPPLRGIIHSAGVVSDASLLQQTWPNFARVLGPKVVGSWLLHERTRDRALDFFVLFSSATAILGTRGQANHAAANAFQDALALRRRHAHQAGLSINWGAWADVGYAARDEVRATLAGVQTISVRGGLQALEWTMAEAASRRLVLPMEWRHARAPRFSRLSPAAAAGSASSPEPRPSATASAPPPSQKRSPTDWRQRLEETIRRRVAETLGVPASAAELDQPFGEIGLDSLMAVELRNRLSEDLGQRLPATMLLDHPSIAKLLDYLVEVVPAPEPERAEVHPDVQAPHGARSAITILRQALPAIFVIPGVDGEFDRLDPLSAQLGHHLIAGCALDGAPPETASLEALAQHLVAQVRSHQPDGPYTLLGWSWGGPVAHAMAGILERAGARVRWVGMIDPAPWSDVSAVRWKTLLWVSFYSQEVARRLDAVVPAQWEDLAARTESLPPAEQVRSVASWAVDHDLVGSAVSAELVARRLEPIHRRGTWLRSHRPGIIDAPLQLRWALRSDLRSRHAQGWSSFTRGACDERTIDGDHFSVLEAADLGFPL